MRGNAQPDGRPLELRHNSGSTFRSLWTKVYRIKLACAGVSVVCNAVYRLTMFFCVSEIFAIKSRNCAKSRRNFDVLGQPNLGKEFLTEFYKCGSPSNMWQSLVTIR